MPTFNEATVRQLIAKVDSPYNASLLKVGYFASHRQVPYSTADGEALIDDALIHEQSGTFRWFMLQMVRGFAAFHAQDVDVDEGFDAYSALFDSNVSGTTHETQIAMRQSVRDFVTGIDTSLKRKGDQFNPRVVDLLLKAWDVWHILPLSAIDAKRPIDWSRAVAAANAQDKFTATVEDALKDTTHPPDFSMLKLAVVVLQDKEPKRVIGLLKTAQSKLPPNDYYDQQWLYQTWTQLITGKMPQEQSDMKVTDKTQLAALVEMRKDQISYTGHGYADLLQLYWRLDQNDKATELIKVVNEPGIRAPEKIDVAKVLLHPPSDLAFDKKTVTQLQQLGVSLLQAYLTSEPRRPNDEIRARYELGRYFMKQDQITEALRALDIDAVKPPAQNTETAMYYHEILQMKAELAKKLKGLPGVR